MNRESSGQLGMLRRDGDAQSIGHSYVPVLLLKRGEVQALAQVDARTWAGMTPFVRVVPPELHGRDDGAPPPALRHLTDATGDHAVYLDGVGCPRRKRRLAPLGATYLQQVYETALSDSLAFAPVYPFGRPELADTVRAFADSPLGAAVLVPAAAAMRIGASNLTMDLRSEVYGLEVEPMRLDVFVDLGYIAPDSDGVRSVVRLVEQVAAAAPWRSMIVGGTSVPDSVSDEVPDGRLGGISRRELDIHDLVVRAVDLPMRYADYAVQHPLPPTPGAVPRMRASIRYTTTDAMLVSRGDGPLNSVSPDEKQAVYRGLAARLTSQPRFAGPKCCWGDERIEALANGRQSARSQTGLRAVATCHHLTVVAAERAGRSRTSPSSNPRQVAASETVGAATNGRSSAQTSSSGRSR